MCSTPTRSFLTLYFCYRFPGILTSRIGNGTIITLYFPIACLYTKFTFPTKHLIDCPRKGRIEIKFLPLLFLIILIDQKNRIIEFTQRFNIIIRSLLNINIPTSITPRNRTKTNRILYLRRRSGRRTGSHRNSITIICRKIKFQCTANLMIQLNIRIEPFKRRI